MTKEQFLKTYGQPNTVVSFKNLSERMQFLKQCDEHLIKWIDGTIASEYTSFNLIKLCNLYNVYIAKTLRLGSDIVIAYTPSPKSLIKDGWIGVERRALKVYFLPSINTYAYYRNHCHDIESSFNDDLCFVGGTELDIMELYDNLGNLQWKREEKSAKYIEIERIQSEMNKLAQDLSKLKGE